MKKLKAWLYGIKADKWLHVIVALVVVEVLFLAIFHDIGKPAGLTMSAAITVALCCLKELYDMDSNDGVASWGDIIAGIVGIVIGVMVMMVL